jgi:hypothetical protein
MINFKSVTLLVAVSAFLAFMMPGCGSGGGGGGGGGLGIAGGGIGGTGVTSGTVTGFGSVFVNGIEFETSGTRFDVDDDPAAIESDLGIGMVVTVIGRVNNDGVTGMAESIEYDEEIEGPIAAMPVEDPDMVTKSFDVFDVTVVVDRNTTVFAGTDYAGLKKDDIVEVSGFFDEFGNLLATRVEQEGVLGGATGVEVKGTVACGGAADCGGNFTLGTLAVSYDGFTDLAEVPGGVVADGQFVEVKGALTPPSMIAATRIELEDEGLGNNVEQASIEGIVTDFNGIGDFKVSGQQVDASGAGVDFQPAILAGTLGNGDEIEVEGAIAGGLLQATEVEQRGGDVKISAVVDSVDTAAGTVTLEIVAGQPLVTVAVDGQTQLEDETGVAENLSIFNIDAGDFLNIEAYIDGETLIASQVERDELEDIELQGPADVPQTGGDNLSGQVSILGVIIMTGAATDFEDASDEDIEAAAFFAAVSNGDLIAFRGIDADGLAEEVEFED